MKRLLNGWRMLGWLLLQTTLAPEAPAAQSALDLKSLLYNTNTAHGVNWQSARGVPLSSTPGNGSDGRNSMLPLAPTPHQFEGGIIYGGVTHQHAISSTLGSTFAGSVDRLDWPRVRDGRGVVTRILRANVSPPYFSQQVSLLFGSIIPVPTTDVAGNPLTGVAPGSYWAQEPFTTNIHTATLEHTNVNYYWSPHAQAVFGIRAGGLEINWRRLSPLTNALAIPPAGYLPNETHTVIGSSYYPLRKVGYVISGVPFKTTQKLFWTEGNYRSTGKPVFVPDGRVKDIKFVYNTEVPEFVRTNEVVAGMNINPELTLNQRTVNFANGLITAYNRTGRIFVELLGDSSDGVRRRHLGFEIVDVLREAIPDDVTIELGERVTAYPENDPSDRDLEPSPINQGGVGFAYRHDAGSAGVLEFYAIRETQNLADYQVHWTKAGVEGLRWPFRFSRYKFVWPADPSRYSHYVRQSVATEEEARATAVVIDPENVPTVEHEDPSDRVRAKLTPDSRFYTWLDSSIPIHRSLLRYNVGANVAFERVRSVLDSELRQADPDAARIVLAKEDPVTDSHLLAPPGNLFGAGSFTLETWVFARSVQASAAAFDFGNGPAADNIFLGLSQGVSGKPYFEIFSGASNGGKTLVSPTSLPLDAWVHLAATFDAVSRIGILYINGVAVVSGALTRPRDLVRSLNYLGRSAGSDQVSDASFASVRIWSVARTEAQLRSGMNSSLLGPRYVETDAQVGQRLEAPVREDRTASGLSYLAGHVHQPAGTGFSVSAYLDPFEVGFPAAAKGAVIPVNAPNNDGRLEVWWFRPNAVDTSLGFKRAYWPSIITRYTVVWPTEEPHARDLVLASNAGSGALGSVELKARLYVQNDPELPGYNPNEEHALMEGGQVWALRDDLNVTSGEGYSSHPYVLLEFPDTDGRPSMSVFRVLREKGSIRFDYRAEAGTLLNAPMPLPLLGRPLARLRPGQRVFNFNAEVGARRLRAVQIAEAGGVSRFALQTTERHFYQAYERLALQQVPVDTLKYDAAVAYGAGPLADLPPVPLPLVTRWLYTTNSSQTTTNLAGFVSTLEPFALGAWAGAQPASSARYRYLVKDPAGIELDKPVVVANPAAGTNWLATARGTNIVGGNAYVEVEYSDANASADARVREASVLVVPSAGELATTYAEVSSVSYWRIAYERLPEAVADTDRRDGYARFTFQDRKGDIWVYRGPHREEDSAKLVMQFYYKTRPGFYFPSKPYGKQPPVGIVTPYLRPRNSDGTYAGDPVYSSTDRDLVGDGNAIGISYHPVWPEVAPVLYMGETLTLPKRGLPSVRGQTSLEVLYQQSEFAGGELRPAALLHDPTREREFQLAAAGTGGELLDKLPDSVRTETSRGKVYFPNLAPHLVERFFYDPSRGANGALVFKGEFKDEALGDKYVLLNVLARNDARALQDLCLSSPSDQKKQWDYAITNGLVTVVEKFVEDPGKPGTFKPDGLARTNGPMGLSVVWDSDVAVDSYALTAMGPGTGYLTLVSGQGQKATPPGEPVSLHVIRVVDTLYRGEVKVVTSSNPLNEKVTLQQVVDLGGRVGDFQFEWRIASPQDGSPPPVDQLEPRTLIGDGTFTHVRHPLPTDRAATIHTLPSQRTRSEVTTQVVPITEIPFLGVSTRDGRFFFLLDPTQPQLLVEGNSLVLRDVEGREIFGRVVSIGSVVQLGQTFTELGVAIDPGQTNLPESITVTQLDERALPGQPQSLVYREFSVPAANRYAQYFLSLDLDSALGAKVYVDGQLAVVANLDGATPTTTAPSLFSPLSRVYRIAADLFDAGVAVGSDTTHRVVVELFSAALPGVALDFNLHLEAYQAEDLTELPGTPWLKLASAQFPDKVRTVIGENADVRALSDNYVISRYRATGADHVSKGKGWSRWTEPALAEGWIKRVLAGLNPFNQRLTDLFNNQVNTDVSLLTQAGPRWEGDVALNLESINNYGLIEIYETVLRRGRMLSIDAGINYGPANDALLLASGYLNDLYMMLGNEAQADAANPTIGIGTKDRTYGDIATALFSFKGQVPSLLEEELALLRGRDDFLQPGVELRPVYNRLVWNYTRGIDSGEAVYALNYNIQENNDTGVNGVIDADDARKMFPQGHGDAYGHYLTAVKGYYSLLVAPDFDWVPRIEAVNVLGKPVAVDYQDERKFAAAATALARTGRQVFDLTWRRDFVPGDGAGWDHFETRRTNPSRGGTERNWGADHWASRTLEGAYVNWAIGNSILPAVDPDPAHEGIRKVDRTTVPELKELTVTAAELQTALDNAEGHLTPLGLPSGGLAFDINPNRVTGANPESHFEQIYARAKQALDNALAAFDDAKDVSRLMRSEQDSLAELQASVQHQELAFNNQLIELYGTPYPDDIGPGRTYLTGYEGPDLIHFAYVEITDTMTNQTVYTPNLPATFNIDIQSPPGDWDTALTTTNWIVQSFTPEPGSAAGYSNGVHYLTFEWGPHGFFGKPPSWKGQRVSPGRIQQAISEYIHAHDLAYYSMAAYSVSDKQDLDKMIQLFNERTNTLSTITSNELAMIDLQKDINNISVGYETAAKALEVAVGAVEDAGAISTEALPTSTILGTANGGDLLSAPRAALFLSSVLAKNVLTSIDAIAFGASRAEINAKEKMLLDLEQANNLAERDLETKQMIVDLGNMLKKVQGDFLDNNTRLRFRDDAQRHYAELKALGNRIQAEREIARRRASALIQGFRTRDAAFRIFRNEKLERYKSLFDLAARYVYLAANAYDYETGLLDTVKGRSFVNRIVNSRALGVMRNGEPQYAGSDTGDPGLSSVMAEMKADWDVLKGRLGFNNADGYGTTVSLRTENFRVLPMADGDVAWKDILQQSRRANLLDDADVRRYCLQINPGDGLPVPGLVIEFSTTISDSLNLFGRALAGGDSHYSSSAFATKLFGVGVAFDGYVGMQAPSVLDGATSFAGGTSPNDPGAWYLNPRALSATPYVYLVPVGLDSMRSPPLGDASGVRTWAVDDVAVPLPFNIGGSEFSTKALYQSAESLSEPLFALRKHQSFRAVPTAKAFTDVIFGPGGALQPTQYTNRRLIGRSIWNSKWKLVIPGRELLNDPKEGLSRFIDTVRDVKLHFITYSYSGN